jgi:hypothetical protein
MKRIEFKPPSGLVPEGAEDGTEFEEVATFRVKKNGDICLVAIGEHQMPGYSGKGHDNDYGEKAANRYAEKMNEA